MVRLVTGDGPLYKMLTRWRLRKIIEAQEDDVRPIRGEAGRFHGT